MLFIRDKQFEGIHVKLTLPFLEKHKLSWDQTKASLEEIFLSSVNPSALKQKLNMLALGVDVEIPKLYIQAGLSNLFDTVGDILGMQQNLTLDLGELGTFFSNEGQIHHLPSRAKKDPGNNKKTKIRNLDANSEGLKEKKENFRKNLQISKMAKGEMTNDIKDLASKIEKRKEEK